MIRDEAITKLKAPYPSLQREFPFRFLPLFGSVARSEARPSRICAVSLDLSHQERNET